MGGGERDRGGTGDDARGAIVDDAPAPSTRRDDRSPSGSKPAAEFTAALAAAAIEGLWAIDDDDRTVYANPAMAGLLGCTSSALAAASPWTYVAAADPVAARAVLFGAGHPDRVLRRADGTPLPCRIAARRRLPGPDGRPLDVAFVIDRRPECLLEAEHQANLTRLAAALSVARLVAWQYQPQTDAVVWTPNARELFGLAPDAVLRPGFLAELAHPEDRAALLEKGTRWRALDLGATDEFDFRIVRPDGQVRQMHARCRAQRGPSGERQVFGITHDVTDQRRLEEQLVRTRKLEGIGRLAGGIAHDFNNLITAILTSVSLLDGGQLGNLTEDLAVIRTAALRAAHLTQQLQRFAGKPRMRRIDTDLTDVVLDLEGMLRRLAGEHCALQLELEPDLWTVLGDDGALGEVLIQLVANAAESQGGGDAGACTVTVSTANRALAGGDPVPTGDYVELAVSDGGPSVTESARRDLFEPLAGTGDLRLGLASCYGIVEQHGGHLTVESAPGRGTTVALRLPRSHAPRATASPAPTTGTCETVLLVEDEELVRRMVVRGLAELGYDLLVAADAEEALELAAAHHGPIHLAITDVVLPGLSGAALAERLRVARPELPVIFVSGHLSDVVARHGGADETPFLAKPYTVGQMVAAIRESLAPRAAG